MPSTILEQLQVHTIAEAVGHLRALEVNDKHQVESLAEMVSDPDATPEIWRALAARAVDGDPCVLDDVINELLQFPPSAADAEVRRLVLPHAPAFALTAGKCRALLASLTSTEIDLAIPAWIERMEDDDDLVWPCLALLERIPLHHAPALFRACAKTASDIALQLMEDSAFLSKVASSRCEPWRVLLEEATSDYPHLFAAADPDAVRCREVREILVSGCLEAGPTAILWSHPDSRAMVGLRLLVDADDEEVDRLFSIMDRVCSDWRLMLVLFECVADDKSLIYPTTPLDLDAVWSKVGDRMGREHLTRYLSHDYHHVRMCAMLAAARLR